jgi:drug/metabolite transporter (DMT)-like permease
LALLSALLHAAWNLLVARARSVDAATALTTAGATLMALPLAVTTWHADSAVWPYAAASAVLETAYIGLLALAYRRTDMSFVYPVTRGLAPVLVLVFGVVALGNGTNAGEVTGVLAVAAGILLVRGLGRRHDTAELAVAFGVASCIAAYTIVDREGIQHAGALTYFVLTLGPATILYPPLVAKLWGTSALRGELNLATAAAAAANLGSFTCGLLALRIASAASVLAVRSTGIVIATLLAVPILGERVGWSRALGSAVVFAGIALLALS